MNKIKYLLIIVFCLSITSYGQELPTRTTAMQFLLINTDARSAGIADNGIATSDDAYSIYHNPAKTAFKENQTSISLSYTPWFRSITNNTFVGEANFIQRFREKSAWGVSLKYFSLGKIQLTDAQGANIGTENPNEFALTGSYSMKLSNVFSLGVALKYIYSNYRITIADNNLESVNTANVDISGFYQSPIKQFNKFDGIYRFGFNIANIGPKVKYNSEKLFTPTNLKLGGGFDFIINKRHIIGTSLDFTKLLIPINSLSEKNSLGGMVESFDSNNLKDFTWGLGAEYKYNNTFAVRTGYFHETESRGFRQFLTFGAGFQTQKFTIDLSYLANTSKTDSPLKNTFRFSLSFDL